jgi:hypothetical protein
MTNLRRCDFGVEEFAGAARDAAGFSVAGADGVSAGRRLTSSAT